MKMKNGILLAIAVAVVVLPKASMARSVLVSTREAPLGVDGAGLETVSGDVRLPSMDAEYDVATDTLVKFDGTTPVTNEHYLARRYDCALAPLNEKGVFKTPPVGWMTWYAVKFDASEKTILENARAFREAFGGYTDEKPVLWVDWEWFHRRFNSKGEDGEDMLTPHAASYPRGLKALADDLKGLGFTPALWVSPQVDVRTNALFATHPEWILASHSFWGGHVFADPTAPGYLDDFVKTLFRTYRSWGYEAFKWDCMPYTMWMYDLYHDRFHDKSVSTKEAYRRLVAAGREAIGPDVYLECCSGTGDDPMLWSADAFDAARVGGDIFAWSSFAAEGVDMLLRYYPLHNTVLRCDADNLVLREEFNTLEQARTRVTIYALTGVPITVGDRIDALDAPRIEMLRKAMPVVPMRAASLRPYFRKGNVLSLTAHFARDWGRWQVKSWSNLSTGDVERVKFELPVGHAAWDVWNERLVTATDGKIEFELGPGASRVFRVTPLEAEGPTLLGTTRHLTQGGYELESYAATASGATWRHKLTDRGDERLFLLDGGDVVSVPARAGSWKAGATPVEVLSCRGDIASQGWRLKASEEGKVVYIPFEGYFPSKGGRIESPIFTLDKGANENAWYALSFTAKSTVDGYWWVDFFDRNGSSLPDVNSRLYASQDWRGYDVVVPTRPDAVSAKVAFVSTKGVSVRDVRMRRITAEAAAKWCDAFYSTLPKVDCEVSDDCWAKIPVSRAILEGTNVLRIVCLGDSIMNDSWCGNFGAIVQREFPATDLKLFVSVRGGTGCWYYREQSHFDEYVARYRPNLVLIGGVSNWPGPDKMSVDDAESAMVETIERCKAIGAEVVICTPPPSYEFRKDPGPKPFDRSLLNEAVRFPYLHQAYEICAAARTGVQVWDLTTGPCEAIARSGKPLYWFKRDEAHSDDRGKQLIAQTLGAYFRIAKRKRKGN